MAKLRKAVSLLLTLAMLFGVLSVIPVSAEDMPTPAAWYNFDEVSGNTVPDISGNGKTATATNVSYIDSPMGGKAASLSGSSSYLTLTSGLVTGWDEFTFASWIKLQDFSAWARIFDFGSSTTRNMFLTASSTGGNTGTTTFAITGSGSGGEQKLTTNCPFNTDRWAHVAFTLGNQTATLYVDGVKVAQKTGITNTPGSVLSTNTSNYIGRSHYSADAYLKGQFDDLRVYSTALTEEQVASVMSEFYPEIASVSETEVTTDMGVVPELPSKVKVTYTSGVETDVTVKWDAVTASDLIGVSEYKVNGQLIGTDKTAQATIKINNDSLSEDYVAVIKTDCEYTDPISLSGNYSVYNCTDKDSSLLAILAAYDENGALVASERSVMQISSRTLASKSLKLAVPEELLLQTVTVKGFLWGGEGYYIPAANVSTDCYEPLVKGSTFNGYDVQLLDGVFEDSMELGSDYLLSFDVDRFLAPLYTWTSYTSPATRYSGWEAANKDNGEISGHMLGHYLSACSAMYAQTGNQQYKDIIDHAVEVILMLQDEDGFVAGFKRSYLDNAFNGQINASAFDLNGCWVPWYSLHKIYQGLIDCYEVAGNEDALVAAERLAEYAMNGCDRMTDQQLQTMLNTEQGGMMDIFVELYNITGKTRYIEMAKRWTHHAIVDSIAAGQDTLTGKHANTQIPKFVAAIRYYEATGDEYYYNAASNFWDYMVNDRSYIIGGNSRSEHLDSLGTETLATNTCESCNTHNMLKLTEELYKISHDVKYVEYYEKALYNHMLASQDPATGAKTYFVSTLPGQFKVYGTHDNAMWCCTGSGLENPARYHRFIYYKEASTLTVNLYIASSVDWKEKGIKISQITDFPNTDTAKFVFDEADNVSASIKLYAPSWAKGMTVSVNGTAVNAAAVDGYITIDGVWNTGDVIDVQLPMSVYEYKSREAGVIGYMYGPLVLAGGYGTSGMPSSDIVPGENDLTNYSNRISVNPIVTDLADPNAYITKADDSLTFTINALQPGTGKSMTTLVPFYNMHHQRYSVYWTKYTVAQYEATGGSLESFEDKLFAVTVDVVEPGFQQSEIGHDYEAIGNTFTDYYANAETTWRDLRGIGSLNYTMKVDNTKKNYLLSVFWGSDGGFTYNGVSYTRTFDIIVDGTKLATYTLNNPKSNSLYYLYYEIPAELVAGKESVRVTYQSNSANTCAGGLFGVRTTTGIVQP